MSKSQPIKSKDVQIKDKSKEVKKKVKVNPLESEGCIMLNYRAGHTSNLIDFEEPLATYTQKNFGKGAQIFRTGEYFIHPEISFDPAELSPEKDPAGVRKAEIQQQAKNRISANLKLEEDRPKIYAIIWGQLSLESEAIIKKHPNYVECDRLQCPKMLRDIYRVTHLLSTSGDRSTDIITESTRFTNMRMGDHETLEAFYKRFSTHVLLLKEIRAHVDSEPLLAAWFVHKLNFTFTDFKKILSSNRLIRKLESDVEFDMTAVFVDEDTFSEVSDDKDERKSRHGDDREERVSRKSATDRAAGPQTVEQAYNTASEWETATKAAYRKSSGQQTQQEQAFTTSDSKATGKEAPKKKTSGKEKKPKAIDSDAEKAEDKPHDKTYLPPEEFKAARKAAKAAYKAAMDEARAKGGGTTGVHFGQSLEFDDVILESMHNSYDGTVEHQALAASRGARLGKYEVLLDNQSTVDIFVEETLLSDIRETDDGYRIEGIGGSIYTNLVGDVNYFGTVKFSPDGLANILSKARVRDRGYTVTVDDDARTETIHVTEDIKFVFREKYGGLHVCDMSDLARYVDENVDSDSDGDIALVQTVEEMAAQYSIAEVKAAKSAREWMRKSGYADTKQLQTQLKFGTVANVPFSIHDLQRADMIFGKDLASIKGKTTHRKGPKVKFEYLPSSIRKDQTLHLDLMFVQGIPFLITVSDPLGLLMATSLSSKSAVPVLAAIKSQLADYQAHNFRVPNCTIDGEGAIVKITADLNRLGIVVNPAGPGDHVPKIERNIRTVKERVRCHVTTSPFNYCKLILTWCVLFCVQRLNMEVKTNTTDHITPREHFTGVKADFNRDFSIGFGDYVQVAATSETSNDTSQERTLGAIAVLQTGNRNGSVKFLLLKSWRVVTRTSWTSLPMPASVIDFLNAKASTESQIIPKDPVFARNEYDNVIVINERNSNSEMDVITPDMRNANEQYEEDLFVDYNPPHSDFPVFTGETYDAQPSDVLNTLPDDMSSSHYSDVPTSKEENVEIRQSNVEVETINSNDPGVDAIVEDFQAVAEETRAIDQVDVSPSTEMQTVLEKEPIKESRYNLRSNRKQAGHYTRREYGLHLSVSKAKRLFGERPTLVAIAKEAINLSDKQVNEPVHVSSMTSVQRKNIIRAHTFLKEKFNSKGEFEKLKARTVADGSKQDKSVYGDNSSPTVATSSVFMIAAIAANEGRHVMTCDIGGAFLHADMDLDVYVRYEPEMTALLVECDPNLSSFVQSDGSLVCRLKKALYGCIQAAKLWNEKLSKFLQDQGFVPNEYDVCVFNKIVDKEQITICLHVDDCLCTSVNKELLETLSVVLLNEYKELAVHWGVEHSYLGMTFLFPMFAGRFVKITMEHYIEELLNMFHPTGNAVSPATDNLFEIDDNSTLLSKDRKELFHSVVAKALYLAKRVRPDILLTCSFLAGRVQVANEQDYAKLQRLVNYLYATCDLGICLEAGNPISVFAYVDASHGVHIDGKGHTGAVISLFKGSVYVKSSKQKINTKSSTESELVGISDSLSMIIWIRNFLEAQGYCMSAAVLYQDNQSTIVLANKGASTSERTRHVALRYFFVKDRIQNGEISLQYLSTQQMIADILTKPLQGSLFRRLRDELLNLQAH